MNEAYSLSQEENVPFSIKKTSYEKGADFESHIISLFNKKCSRFELLKEGSANTWVYGKAAGSLFPDLKFLFFTKTANYKFAIECKWRELFVHGKIKWAEQNQIRNYQLYEKRNHVPMFIAIGIGGIPSNPAKLFVTPLSEIGDKTEVYEQELIAYTRNTKHRFSMT